MAIDLPSDSVFLDQSSSSGFLGSAVPPTDKDDLDSLQGDPWETAESTEQAELDEFEALEAATRGQSASKPPAFAARSAPNDPLSGPQPESRGSKSHVQQAQAPTAAVNPDGSPPRSALVCELFGGAGPRDSTAPRTVEHGYDGAGDEETRFHDGHERPDGGEYGTDDQTAPQPDAVMPPTQLARPHTSSSSSSPPGVVPPPRGRGRAGATGSSPTARHGDSRQSSGRMSPRGDGSASRAGLAAMSDAAMSDASRRDGVAAGSDGSTSQEAALQAIVEGRVARLEEAMRRYRAEVEREAANADARDREADALRRERQGLREWRAAEQKRLDTWKEEETKKMAKEKRIAIRQARAGLASGTELKQLKLQVADMTTKLEAAKVEAAARERRVKAAATQMRKQLVESRERTTELEAQLRRSEEERLRWWEEAVRLREAAAKHKEQVLMRASQARAGGLRMEAAPTTRDGRRQGAGTGTGRGVSRAEQARTVASRLRGNDWLAGDEVEDDEEEEHGQPAAVYADNTPHTEAAVFEAGASPPHTGDEEWGGTEGDASSSGGGGVMAHRDQTDRHALENRSQLDAASNTETDGEDPVILVSGLSLEAVAGDAEPAWGADGTDESSSRSADTNGDNRSRARADIASISTRVDPPVLPPGVISGSPRASSGSASNAVVGAASDSKTSGKADGSVDKGASPPPGLASSSRVASTWPDAMLQAVAELALVDGDPAAPGAASRIVTGRRERGDGKWELTLEDGSRLTVFRNGTHKEARAGGVTVVRFNNGDVRQSWGDRGVVVYYYSDASTVHVTHSSGEQVFRFPSGQVERHAADGTKHIDYPDGTQKTVMPSGEQRSTFPDGTTMVELPDGSHVVSPPGTSSSSSK